MADDLHLLSGAYAVDALDPQERAAFEEHLTGCASCTDEVASLRAAAAMLSELEPIEPPASLRAGVLDAIASTRPLPPPPSHRALAAEDVAPVRPLSTQRRWGRARRWGSGLLVAAVAVIAVLTAWHPWTGQSTDQVDRIIAAADAQRLVQTLPNGGAMTVYRSISLDSAAVVATGLPDPGKGKVYEVWLQNDAGAMVPAAVLPDDHTARVVLKGSAATATAAGVTVEPTGGSPAPTTKPVMLFGFTTG
ncbi:anti-sigma factor [Nocardioides sp.]|uniref:anti-sigma factor n=1 Tax=Nocardioides sp. TaxID=35761 RepID=UPI00262C620B|nr:anti-sigma factor [Nocardioides sp.]